MRERKYCSQNFGLGDVLTFRGGRDREREREWKKKYHEYLLSIMHHDYTTYTSKLHVNVAVTLHLYQNSINMEFVVHYVISH